MFLNHTIPRSIRLLVCFLAFASPAAHVSKGTPVSLSTHISSETKVYGRVRIKDSEAPLPPDTTVVVLKPGSKREVQRGKDSKLEW